MHLVWSVAVASVIWLTITSAEAALAPGAIELMMIVMVALPYAISVRVLFWDRERRRRRFYALTDRRALILKEGQNDPLQSVSLGQLVYLSHYVRRDGSGSIAFGRWLPDSLAALRHHEWSLLRRRVPRPTFEGIEEVQRVYDLAREARDAARARAQASGRLAGKGNTR